MQIGVITNPNSRKNRSKPNRAADLQSIVGDIGEVHQTESIESIKPILREFLRKRALHCMLREGMEVLAEDEFANQNITLPVTLPTKGGTIDFVANNVGIKGKAEDLLAELRARIESGSRIDEIEVDSMLCEGIEVTPEGDVPFVTYGFATAAGGVGQRFFSKYSEDEDPNPATIVKVLANVLASMPVSLSPLRAIPGMPSTLKNYASDLFEPHAARVTLDGMVLPNNAFTGIHIASMSINLGGVFRFFSKADKQGQMHALVGQPSPFVMLRNLPRFFTGGQMNGKGMVDRACREMTMEAVGDELLTPIIDGEYYHNVRKMTFKLGPRVRIPKVVSRFASAA
jgi:hypothetical protein